MTGRRFGALLTAVLIGLSGAAGAGAVAQAGAAEQAETAAAAEAYDVVTLLARAQFESRPRIAVYNYLLGDSVCRLAEYDWTGAGGAALLVTLTPDAVLTQALEGSEFDDMAAMLRLAMGALEDMGFVVDMGELTELHGRPCYMFAAYTDSEVFAGWAVMDARQAQFVLASGGADAFLRTVRTRTEPEFDVAGGYVEYGGVRMRFPHGAIADGGHAECGLDGGETAELMTIGDLDLLAGADGEAILKGFLPDGTADIAVMTLGGVPMMEYVYDDAERGAPVQGRVMLLGGHVLRMEALLDNAGDAFMRDLVIEAE